ASAVSSGLRVLYRECDEDDESNTEIGARRIKHWVDRALAAAGGGASIARRFRVEVTTVGHEQIPGRYAPSLLDDIAAHPLADASDPPAETRAPKCAKGSDWIGADPTAPHHPHHARQPHRELDVADGGVGEDAEAWAESDPPGFTPSEWKALRMTSLF